MITIISSAKTMNFNDINTNNEPSYTPIFINEAQELVKYCQQLSMEEISELMNVSEKIATKLHFLFKNFNNPQQVSKIALYSYDGDVYRNLERDTYTTDDLLFANDHIYIISGLYGILKPLDLIKPYRLEISTKLINYAGKNLYMFWYTKISNYVISQLISRDEGLINLASKDYFNVVNHPKLRDRVVNIEFKEYKDNTLKVIGVNAKRIRGKMLNYIIKNKINDPVLLKDFKEHNYYFRAELSDSSNYIFIKN